MKSKFLHYSIITVFVALYLIVSTLSTIHVIDFFRLSNPEWLAISLAVAFEVGAAASLASLVVLEKMNKSIVWVLFFVLTAMQAMGNAYYSYSHLHDFQSWVELFGLVDEEVITQKRILSIISGAILPLISLGFIKSLVDYLRPTEQVTPSFTPSFSTPLVPTALSDSIKPEDVIIQSGEKEIVTPEITVDDKKNVEKENKVSETELSALDRIKVFKGNGS